jgi:hypothetical protein
VRKSIEACEVARSKSPAGLVRAISGIARSIFCSSDVTTSTSESKAIETFFSAVT